MITKLNTILLDISIVPFYAKKAEIFYNTLNIFQFLTTHAFKSHFQNKLLLYISNAHTLSKHKRNVHLMHSLYYL